MPQPGKKRKLELDAPARGVEGSALRQGVRGRSGSGPVFAKQDNARLEDRSVNTIFRLHIFNSAHLSLNSQ